MKRKTYKCKLLAALLALLLLLFSLIGCVMPPEKPGDETERGSESGSERESESETETSSPAERYEYTADINESLLDTGYDPAYLILANKEHPLGSDYAPRSLSRLSCNTTYPMDLESRAADALYEMLREMEADGLDVDNDGDDGPSGYDIAVTSAYRSYHLQEELFAGYIEQEMNNPKGFSTEAYAALGFLYIHENYTSKNLTRLSEEDARRVVQSYSAEAGKSEHQTGLCVDFITEDMQDSLTAEFEEKQAFFWLSENAHKFGFILRYPKGKEDVTGYTYEPWHYRFVGREAATEIREAGLTLEEYLDALPSGA